MSELARLETRIKALERQMAELLPQLAQCLLLSKRLLVMVEKLSVRDLPLG